MITKEEFGATIKAIGKISFIEIKNNDAEMVNIRLRYSTTQLFCYIQKPSLVKRAKNYKVNDVIEVEGNFLANFYPGAKSSLPVVNEVIKIKKLGTIKK